MKSITLLAVAIGGVALGVAGNTPPVVEAILDVATPLGVAVQGIPVFITDPESSAEELVVRAVSSNTEVVPESGFRWSGTGSRRALTIQPLSGRRGIVTITIEVRDPQGSIGLTSFRVFTRAEQPWLAIDPIPPQRGWQSGPTLRIPVSMGWDASADVSVSVSATVTPSDLLSGDASIRWAPEPAGKQRMLWISMPKDRAGVGQVSVVARRMGLGISAAATFPVVVERAPLRWDTSSTLPLALERAPRFVVDWDGVGGMDFIVGGAREVEVWAATSVGYAVVATAPFEVYPLEVGVVDFDGDGQPDVVARGLNQLGLWRGSHRDGRDVLDPVMLPRELVGQLIRGMLWKDFDGDGDVDALVVQGLRTVLVVQEPDGWMVRTIAGTPLGWPAAAADVDGDGDLDLMASTSTSPTGLVSSSAGIWWNDGLGRFATNGPPILTALMRSVGWEDFDGNGLPEPWMLWAAPGGDRYMVTYRKVPSGWEESGRALVLANDDRSWGWGDMDADGVLDAVVPVSEDGRSSTTGLVWETESAVRVLKGDGRGGFEASGAVQTLGRAESMSWMANGNGGLDLAIGRRVLRNEFQGFNLPPGPPRGLRSWVSGGRVRLTWFDAWDLNQANGLTYNVRVGTRPGAEDVMAAMSHADGRRRVVSHGNAGGNRFLDLDLSRVRTGPLYWSVQAVDASYAGGNFAEEQRVEGFPSKLEWTATLNLEVRRVAGGFFVSKVYGVATPPKPMLLETSTDLRDWTPVRWLQPQADGRFAEDYPNPDPGGGRMRFFRAKVSEWLGFDP